MPKKILTLYVREGIVEAKLYSDGNLVEEIANASIEDIQADDIASKVDGIDAIAAPGGVLKPLKKGLYLINDAAIKDAGAYGDHEYNKIMHIAYDIAQKMGVPAYMINPMSSDELLQRNRISSNSRVPKFSRYYALEHAAAIEHQANNDAAIAEDNNYIVAYIDNLVSVGAHMRGFCIDVNDMIGQEGPMGFTSSGDVPVKQLVGYVDKNGANIDELCQTLVNECGLKGYLGIDTPSQVDAATDECSREIIEAMVYQIAKWIGSSAMVLRGQVSSIILTGKGASSCRIVDGLKKRTEGIAPVAVITDLDVAGYMARKAATAATFATPLLEY